MARRTIAARQVISSAGHSPSNPGFSGDGKGLPAGSIEASPCRPRRRRRILLVPLPRAALREAGDLTCPDARGTTTCGLDG
jgi:hypothetical protein